MSGDSMIANKIVWIKSLCNNTVYVFIWYMLQSLLTHVINVLWHIQYKFVCTFFWSNRNYNYLTQHSIRYMFSICITGRGSFLLHSPTSSHTLMTILQIPTFNPTSFPVLTSLCYIVRHQCNSRACLSLKNAMSPMIPSRDLWHYKQYISSVKATWTS